MTICRPSASKSRLGRPLGEKAQAIRTAVLDLVEEFDVMTVRQVFYALTVRGVVPKAEAAGYRPVQTQVLKMRREGILPWHFIADSTRWQRKPETFDSVDDVLEETARTYRRNLWRSQSLRIEVWLEKDALASIVAGVTDRWDVALMVSRGTASATFLYEAAQAARDAADYDITTYIFALYDYDAAGLRCARTVEKGLRDYSGRAEIVFERLAVTEEQIEAWNLPTRPAKTSDPEARTFGAEAVELDAIPPNLLARIVDEAIIDLIDPQAWAMEQAAQESERQILQRIAETRGAAA